MPSPHPQKLPLDLLAIMVVCALSVVSLLYLPVPILALLAQNYHITPSQAAASLSAFGFAYAGGFLLFGALSDRLGRKIVMLGGLIALTLVTLALTQITNWPLFLGGRICQGLAAASFPPVALAYLSERGTPQQRIWAIAWMSTAFLAAGILGQIYALEVAVPWGLSWAFTGLAVIYCLSALRLAFIKNEAPAMTAKSWLETYKPYVFLLGNPDLRRVYLCALMVLLCFVTFYLALDHYLGAALQERGISKLQIRLIALPVFALTLFAPKLIAYFKGAQKLVNLGLGLTVMGLILAALSTLISPIFVLASSLVFVAGIALSVPGLIARTAAVSAPEIRGAAISFYTFVLFVGASLSPYLVSAMAQFSLSVVFLILAGLAIGAVIYNVTAKRGK